MNDKILKILLGIFIVLILIILILNFLAVFELKRKNNFQPNLNNSKIEFQGPPPGAVPNIKGPKALPPYFEP